MPTRSSWRMDRIAMSPARIVVVAALAIAGGIVESAGASRVDADEPEGRLMFSVFDESDHTFLSTHVIDLADGAGSELPLPGPEGGGRWSTAGDEIAVMTILEDGRVGTAVIEADGTVDRILSPPDDTLNLVCVTWSPDDLRLACEGWDDTDPSRRGIYAVDAADGGEMVRLTSADDGLVDVPGDFTADGSQLVFRRSADEAEGALNIVSVNGGRTTQLADGTFEDPGRVSPDGNTVLTASNGEVILLSAAGEEVGRIAVDGAYLFGPVWSPDGAWIGFSQAKEAFMADVVISRPDGTDARTVDAPAGNKITLDWGAPTASGSGSALSNSLVGGWQQVTTCSELRDAFTEYGIEDILPDALAGNGLVEGSPAEIAGRPDRCDGAVPRLHSHFFTADGQFGSRDWNGAIVDDGTYTVDGSTVRLSTGAGVVALDVEIDGGDLELAPVEDSSCGDDACRGLLAYATMVAIPGSTWHRDTETDDPIEGMFDVGGHELYLRCTGSGSPTVVYLHGYIQDPSGGGAQNAGEIPDLLDEDFRVCVYDRANVGRSGTVDGYQSGADSAGDLDALLGAAGVPGPYVLLGASFGGILSYIYAGTYPDLVIGMVLLDPTLPGEPEWAEEWLGGVGIAPDDWERATEGVDHLGTFEDAAALRGHAPAVPMTLIAPDVEPPPDFPVEGVEAFLAMRQTFLDEFSPGRVVLADTPHYMEPVIPELIADEVRAVVAEAHRG